MLALAGYPLGLQFRIFDPAPDACAGQVVAEHVVGGFDDKAALRRFAEGVDVITYEWENVPVDAVRLLSRFAAVYPPVEALEVAQDRFLEKSLFRKLGIETAPFAAVDSLEGLREAAGVVGLPAVLKTRRLGYDGKGQYRLQSEADVQPAWEAVGRAPSILEGFVPFKRELSLIAVRGPRRPMPQPLVQLRRQGLPEQDMVTGPLPRTVDAFISRQLRALREGPPAASARVVAFGYGKENIAVYPVVENVHRDGILRVSRAPAPDLGADLQGEAEDIASLVMEATGYVGVLAIELFEHEGRLLANELAPRVHNSGHWTIEGAETSQFENHVRAVCGLPLGAVAPRGHSAMVNLIGAVPDSNAVLRIPGAHLHFYGKEPRPGRKVGHVTVRADEAGTIDNSLSQLLRLIENVGG
jgi:5-(carboxyamino)imidazole ribonucleotide synthase